MIRLNWDINAISRAGIDRILLYVPKTMTLV